MIFRMMIVAAALVMGALVPSSAHAAVAAADWQTTGDGLLTRDTVNGLDWLDLTVTRGLSVNDAVALTRPGQTFEGFRIARLDQLFGLYGQAVGPVVPAFNGNTPIFDFTPEERAAQRQFVDLIGVTITYDFPDFGTRRDAIGLLRTTPGTEDSSLLAGGLFFYFDDRELSFSWFNDGYTNSRTYSDPSTGIYLVRSLGAVPEPATWLMMVTAFGLVGTAMRYRRDGARGPRSA